jgi:LysM repeat protein
MAARIPTSAVAIAGVAVLAGLALAAATGRVKVGDGRPAAGREGSAASEERAGDAAVAPPVVPAEASYTVQAGDTLSHIATSYATTVEELMEWNDLADADALVVGQTLKVRLVASGEGPALRSVPDSELVNGPTHVGFDVAAFVAGQAGPLGAYVEAVNGETLGGAEIVERVARDFSVGPRVLLAMLEARSGFVTGSAVADAGGADYPAGLVDPSRSGLWLQLNWLADRLNGGYYDWKTRGNRILMLRDGAVLAGDESLGPGSFAVQRALALQSTSAELAPRIEAFIAAYQALFGDPWSREAAVPAPGAAGFPDLGLPWQSGRRWWLTGGPHGGWADGSAWAALDFVPDGDPLGCAAASEPATAVTDGLVVHGGPGQLYLDLDGDGVIQTGPVVFYLHLATDGLAAAGRTVRAGEVLGYPSCEGGASNATHLHIARLLDGEWLPAAGADPLVLGRWTATGDLRAYDGGLVDGRGQERTACECRQEGHNDVTW